MRPDAPLRCPLAIPGPVPLTRGFPVRMPHSTPRSRDAEALMSQLSRRAFTGQALRSLTPLALLEGLAAHRLFGADVKPFIDDWLARLNAISRDLKDQALKDLAFQDALEDLYRRVDL